MCLCSSRDSERIGVELKQDRAPVTDVADVMESYTPSIPRWTPLDSAGVAWPMGCGGKQKDGHILPTPPTSTTRSHQIARPEGAGTPVAGCLMFKYILRKTRNSFFIDFPTLWCISQTVLCAGTAPCRTSHLPAFLFASSSSALRATCEPSQ